MLLLYVSKYNCIYDHKKGKNFPMLILTKFKNVEQHCELISHAEFHKKKKKNTESMDRKSLMPLRKVQLSLHRFSGHSQPLNKVCEHLLYQILRLFLSNGPNSFDALQPFHLTVRDALSATFFSDQDTGQWENFRSPVKIRVTYHSQNPLE
jgi:hypothetical protein